MRVRPALLKTIAGSVWLGAGALLLVRGGAMLLGARAEPESASTLALLTSLVAGGWLGALKGRYVLARTARRNRLRIDRLEDPRAWNAFTGGTLLLIGAMIGLGLLLRGLAARGWLGGFTVVGGIYIGIGAALAVSARAYFRADPPPLPTGGGPPPPRAVAPTGVLLVNLGTPDAPTPAAVRRYLREFLGDPRVVEVNRLVWSFVLNVIVLPWRSSASAALYAKVWTADGSPLLFHGRAAAESLARRLGADFRVVLAMRYGNPPLRAGLAELAGAGCEHVVVIPLFPQFSNTTTGSVQAAVARIAFRGRSQPALRFAPPYYDDEGYIEAVARAAEEARAGREIDMVVFSYHGLPEAYVEKGDPYLEHCTRTSWALATRLGLDAGRWRMVFQSRFGDEPWLQPYADVAVPALAVESPRVQMIMPGFASDCLETIEEIGMRLRETFLAAGGTDFIVTPALNSSRYWIDALERIARRECRSADPRESTEGRRDPSDEVRAP